MKRCSKCGENKPVAEFYAEKGGRDGLRADCKNCNLAARKLWYAENKAREIARVKQWQADNPDRVAATRARRIRDPQRDRDQHLRRTFGITLDEYDAMLDAQGGGCAICGRPPAEGKSLHVDHDHETGVVRGLLCFTCNGGLGMLGEDEANVARALDYVSSNGFSSSGALELVSLAQTRAAELVGIGAGERGN